MTWPTRSTEDVDRSFQNRTTDGRNANRTWGHQGLIDGTADLIDSGPELPPCLTTSTKERRGPLPMLLGAEELSSSPSRTERHGERLDSRSAREAFPELVTPRIFTCLLTWGFKCCIKDFKVGYTGRAWTLRNLPKTTRMAGGEGEG
jgi:hypothetical protein